MKTNQLIAGAVGVGLLLLVLAANGAEESETSQAPKDKPSPPPRNNASPPVDPLTEYPLSQQSIIEALVDGLEAGQTMKLRSVMVKAKSASFSLRAYLLAAMQAVPAQMKSDAQFVKDFAAKEAERLKRLENDPTYKFLKRFTSTTKALQGDVASMIPVFGKSMLAISDLIFGSIFDAYYDGNLDASKARRGEDQIIPGREGYGVRRGVRFTPDLPYILPAERALADKVRDRWYTESDSNEVFQSLPTVPTKTAFRYAPTYQDFLDAISKLREDGVS